jgi:hypothetical protein
VPILASSAWSSGHKQIPHARKLKELLKVNKKIVGNRKGRKYDGNFVHTLTLTDIASGWTECVAMPVRNQLLVVASEAGRR